MEQAGFTTDTYIVQREENHQAQELAADICVVGAGISGISAAIEGARAGRKVVLIDGLPTLGGQALNSTVGAFCGMFSNDANGYQFTYGIADEMLNDLGAIGALHYRRGNWITVLYDEIYLARWIERAVQAEENITVVLNAIMDDVVRDGRRVTEVGFNTRHGKVRVKATGFIDATGDAALVWNAGLPCRQPTEPVYGTQNFMLEGLNEEKQPSRDEMSKRIYEKGQEYGLLRRDGFAFAFPGTGIALVNMTHVLNSLDAVSASRETLVGREQADLVMDFLKGEFPEAFGNARVRSYGQTGVRQTRWIVGRHHLTVEEVRAGKRFPDAVARTAWPLEPHNKDGYYWEPFGPDHVHYVPFSSMTPPDVDNVVAAGRNIDADVIALSSVRVMGPCMAMGAAAAHALDLVGEGSVHDVNLDALYERIKDNVDRKDTREG